MTREEVFALLPVGEPVMVTWTGPLGIIRINEMWKRQRLLDWVDLHLGELEPADEWGKAHGCGLVARLGPFSWAYIEERRAP